MSFLSKVLKSESPSYPSNTIPNSNNRKHQTRNSGNIPSFFAKQDYFKDSFFPSAITERKKIDCYIRNADSFKVFVKNLSEALLDPCPTVSTTSTTLLELNILQD